MKYYYNMADTFDHPENEYWTEEQVRSIKLFSATAEVELMAQGGQGTIWCVHDCCGPSWEPVECKDIDEAYEHLWRSLNMSVHEYVHDL